MTINRTAIRETGFALNTAESQKFLDSCAAVHEWDEIDETVLRFDFDPRVEVSLVPRGVYFDRDLAIGEDERAIARAIRGANNRGLGD